MSPRLLCASASRPRVATLVAVAVAAGLAWALGPEAITVASGPAAHVAVVAGHRFPGARREPVLRARRHDGTGHDGAGRIEAVPLGCGFDGFDDAPARFARGIRRAGDALRLVLEGPGPRTAGSPRRAVVAGHAVVIDHAPAPAAARG